MAMWDLGKQPLPSFSFVSMKTHLKKSQIIKDINKEATAINSSGKSREKGAELTGGSEGGGAPRDEH